MFTPRYAHIISDYIEYLLSSLELRFADSTRALVKCRSYPSGISRFDGARKGTCWTVIYSPQVIFDSVFLCAYYLLTLCPLIMQDSGSCDRCRPSNTLIYPNPIYFALFTDFLTGIICYPTKICPSTPSASYAASPSTPPIELPIFSVSVNNRPCQEA